MFRRGYTNPSGDPDGEWELWVRPDTRDNVWFIAVGYTRYKIVDLVTAPESHENESVQIDDAVVTYIPNDRICLIMDNSINKELAVHKNYTVDYGDVVTVKGIFVWFDKNHNLIKEKNEFDIVVRKNTSDNLVKTGKVSLYIETTISQLLVDPLERENRFYSLHDCTVFKVINERIFLIRDSTSNRNITVHIEPSATKPLQINVNDIVNVYGKFRRGYHNPEDNIDGEWELNVRAKSPDRVEKSEYVYSYELEIEILLPTDRPLPPDEIVVEIRCEGAAKVEISKDNHSWVICEQINDNIWRGILDFRDCEGEYEIYAKATDTSDNVKIVKITVRIHGHRVIVDHRIAHLTVPILLIYYGTVVIKTKKREK